MAMPCAPEEEQEQTPPEQNVAQAQDQEEAAATATSDLFDCLHAILHQFEEADGVVDLELREKLSSLHAEMSKVPVPGEVDIEEQLSDLSEKMELLEAKVEELVHDEEAERLLRDTSQMWMPVITGTRSELVLSSVTASASEENQI